MAPNASRGIPNEIPRRKQTYTFLLDQESFEFDLEKICQASGTIKRSVSQGIFEHQVREEYSEILPGVYEFVYNGKVPTATDTSWTSYCNKSYTTHLLSLYYFSESYEMPNFSNRIIDELRAFDERSGRRVRLKHIKDAYENTKAGSKLRWYYAVQIVFWLAGAKDTVKDELFCGRISDLLKELPGLKNDERKARKANKQQLKIYKAEPRNGRKLEFDPETFHYPSASRDAPGSHTRDADEAVIGGGADGMGMGEDVCRPIVENETHGAVPSDISMAQLDVDANTKSPSYGIPSSIPKPERGDLVPTPQTIFSAEERERSSPAQVVHVSTHDSRLSSEDDIKPINRILSPEPSNSNRNLSPMPIASAARHIGFRPDPQSKIEAQILAPEPHIPIQDQNDISNTIIPFSADGLPSAPLFLGHWVEQPPVDTSWRLAAPSPSSPVHYQKEDRDQFQKKERYGCSSDERREISRYRQRQEGRQRREVKKQGAGRTWACQGCQEVFETRNKMFRHLDQTPDHRDPSLTTGNRKWTRNPPSSSGNADAIRKEDKSVNANSNSHPELPATANSNGNACTGRHANPQKKATEKGNNNSRPLPLRHSQRVSKSAKARARKRLQKEKTSGVASGRVEKPRPPKRSVNPNRIPVGLSGAEIKHELLPSVY